MPEYVVDFLEMIEVDGENSKTGTTGLGEVECLCQLNCEGCPIGQVG